MPAPDLVAILEALPTLIFCPAKEAAVDPNRLLLVAPDDSDWILAYHNEKGWFSNDGMRIDEPLVYAALPPAPGRNSAPMISNLAEFIKNLLDDGEYARAASLIDELADRVRAARDSPPSGHES